MKPIRGFYSLLFIAIAATIMGCGSSTSSTGSGSTTNSGGSTASGSNVDTISVNTGLTDYVDGAFTSVTVCVPGSTTSCQTISNILVDTGSSGLRVLSSALTLSLPQQTDSSANPIAECYPFSDAEVWGPVQKADMTIAGETAKSLPIQVIGSSNFSAVPAACTGFGGPVQDTLESFGANGVLGISNFVQDCGPSCTVSGAANFGMYFTCPTSGCVVTEYPLASQVPNPVTLFATDNNGVLIQFPTVTGAETSVNGSLIFGIGTQSNNGLGSATVYSVDPNFGTFTTVYKSVSYADSSVIDTGSNGIYFLDSTITGLPTCINDSDFYCPTTNQSVSATNQGLNGATGPVSFLVANGSDLLMESNDAAVNGLAGPNPGSFDWGLPFFFGRSVFVAIEGDSTPGGTGPYIAY